MSSAEAKYNKAYHSYLVDFMSLKDNYKYDKKHRFGNEDLVDVVPEQILEWMRRRTLGDTMQPDVRQGTVFKLRSSSLAVMKKAVSWYMVDKIASWSPRTLSGNPTKSTEVNDFIRFIKKMEVRKIGKKSTATHPLTMPLFRSALRILEEDQGNFNFYYRYTTMIKFQYHLIGRCDDLGNFCTRDLKSHSNPLLSRIALQTRVYWSKNVLEERDCPDQILFGSWDVDYCILLALGLYLELWISNGTGRLGELLFSDEMDLHGRQHVIKLKNRYQSVLMKSVFSHPTFLAHSTGQKIFGSHSIRKYPSTFARSNGCTSDEIDCRGRWKRDSRRVVDRYIDVEQHWIDGKVAAALCVGGPIRYVAVAGSNISKQWLFEFVVPGISSLFLAENNYEENLVWVLGLAVLWVCMHPEYSSKVPGWLLGTVRDQYEKIRVLPIGVNPVERKKLMVYSVSGDLRVRDIDEELAPEVDNGVAGSFEGGRAVGSGGVNNNNNYHLLQMMGMLQQQMTTTHSQLETISNDIRNNTNVFKGRIGRLERNVNRYLNQPARIINNIQNNNNNINNNNNNNNNILNNNNQINNNNNNINNLNFNNGLDNEAGGEEAGGGGVGGQAPVARLSDSPRTLEDLWEEYATGINGRKPAKDWSESERGGDRHRFCRRKVFWKCVSLHVKAGYNFRNAIDRIRLCYGEKLSVTEILKRMANDKPDGHVNLRL